MKFFIQMLVTTQLTYFRNWNTCDQTIDVETSDPLAGNMLINIPKKISINGIVTLGIRTEWKMKRWWLERDLIIEVIEGQEYMIDFDVSSTSTTHGLKFL